MAKAVLTTQYDADNSKALKAAKEVEKAVNNIGKSGDDSASKIKKGFDAVNDIFGGLLPRNMQTIIRRFKSTQRAVTRSARSFDRLKTSLASLGLPLLVMLLAELIQNWQKYSDMLGITSAETRLLAEEQKKLNEEMQRAAGAIDPYIKVLEDLGQGAFMREAALTQLSRTLRELTDLDLEDADAMDRVNRAVERNMHLVEMRQKVENLEERIKQKKEEIKESGRWYDTEFMATQRQIRMTKYELNPLEEERQRLLEGILYVEADITSEIEDQQEAARKRAEAEREAEQARLRAAKEREQRLKRESDAIDRAEKQKEQAHMDDEARMLDDMRRQEEEELALVRSEEAKQAIREFYENKRREYYEKQSDRQQAEDAAQAERDKQEAERDAQRKIDAQVKLDEKLDAIEQKRMLGELAGEELELMQNAIFYDALLDQADEFGFDKTRIEEERQIAETAIAQKYQQKRIDDAKKEKEAIVAAKTALYSEVASLAGQAAGLAEEGSAAAKGLAVTEVLVSQGIAMAKAAAGASAAAAATGPAAPFTLAAYQLSMVGSVISTFTRIKSILDKADSPGSTGGIGSGAGGGGGNRGTAPLVPNLNFDVENNEAQNVNVSAYVVQSQLQGSQIEYNQALNRVTL